MIPFFRNYYKKYNEIIWLSSCPTHYWRKLFCSVEKKRKNKISFIYFAKYNNNIKYEVGKFPKNSVFLYSINDILIFFYTIFFNPPKLLIIQGYEILPKFFILLLCCCKKIPFCFWGDTNYLIIKEQNFIWKKIKFFFLKFVFLNAEKILYIGKRSKDFYLWLLNKHKKKFFFFPYPTYVKENFFLKKKKNSKKFEIIYIGRIAKEKSLDNFLKSLLKLDKNILKNLVFKIFGNGEQENNLKQFVKNNYLHNTVKFFNSVNSNQVHNLYSKADLFVLPSSKEPWGLVVNEAIFYYVPVLCMYSVGAAKDLIVNNKNGYLMKTIDPFKISSLLKKIYLNRKKAKDIKFYGKYYLNKKYFSFNNTKKQFTKLIDEYSSN